MARSTVFRYKGHSADPQTIGRQLGVQAVLTGHVARRADAFVVGAELVDVDDGSQLWGTMLNRLTVDVSVLQADISEELTGALRLRLSRDEKKRLGKRHTANAEAYQLYLRGRYLSEQPHWRWAEECAGALRACCVRGSQIRPGLRWARRLLFAHCRQPARRLRRDVDRAGAGPPRSTRFAWTMGLPKRTRRWRSSSFDSTGTGPVPRPSFTRALALNPGHAPSRQWHAMFLASRARFDEALAEMNKALELDPLSLDIQTGIGRILHFAGRLDEAIAQYRARDADQPWLCASTH